MFSSNRNLLVIINNASMDEGTIRRQAALFNQILQHTFTPEQFCIAHELVCRNRIRSNKKVLLRETRFQQLRPFRFLINKN